jgi:predicted  nucleic acid-binding Zn-ribbon protein
LALEDHWTGDDKGKVAALEKGLLEVINENEDLRTRVVELEAFLAEASEKIEALSEKLLNKKRKERKYSL